MVYRRGRERAIVKMEQEAVSQASFEAKPVPEPGNAYDRQPPRESRVAVPREGEVFNENGIVARFAVPPKGGIRVNRKTREIVLVDRVDSTVYNNVDDSSTLEYMGRNQDGDYSGEQDQVLAKENLVLRRSKDEGYTVFYFMKEEDKLRFRGIVEYESHEFRDRKNRVGDTRKAIVFKFAVVRGEASAMPQHDAVGIPSADAGNAAEGKVPDLESVEMVEREVSGSRQPASKTHLLRAMSGHIDARSLDRILEYLKRSAKITTDGDAILWTFNPVRTGTDGLNKGKESPEAMETQSNYAAGMRPITRSEMETLDILGDDALMKTLAESDEDVKAGRVSVWKPEDV